jgi:hypothetical protein
VTLGPQHYNSQQKIWICVGRPHKNAKRSRHRCLVPIASKYQIFNIAIHVVSVNLFVHERLNVIYRTTFILADFDCNDALSSISDHNYVTL